MKELSNRSIHFLAQSTADLINYVGIDAPSDTSWCSINYILNSLINRRTYLKYHKVLNNLPHKQVMYIEDEINELLASGKFD